MKFKSEDKKKIELIRSLIAHYRVLGKTFDSTAPVIGWSVDGLFWNDIYKSFDALTESVSMAVGDDCDWIAWFIYDNDCGALGRGYRNDGDKPFSPIKTVEDLYQAIVKDKK